MQKVVFLSQVSHGIHVPTYTHIDNKYEKSACSNPQKRKKGESFCASGVFVLMQDKLPGTDGGVQEVEDNGKGIG